MFADGGLSIVDSFSQKNRHRPGQSRHRRPAPRRSNKIPGCRSEILRLFSESKRIAYERGNFGNPAYLYFDNSDRASQERWSATIHFRLASRKISKMLETLFRNSHAEGLTQRLAKIEEVFFPRPARHVTSVFGIWNL